MSDSQSSIPLSVQSSEATLKQQIVDFVGDFSIELLPKDSNLIAELHNYLPHGCSVYIANPPSASLDDVISVSAQLHQANYNPVPHILARELPSAGHLQQTLQRLKESGVEQLLLIAGDKGSPVGPFDSTLQLLETGLFEQYEFKSIGIAGHPEGSPYAGPNLLGKALKIKNDYAENTVTDMYIVTQLSFDPDNLINWSRVITQAGNRLSIHIGMAGPTKLRTLLLYGKKCGIGASLRTLMKKATALSNLITISTPDELITAIARHRNLETDSPFVKAHFFSFAGFKQTARWVNAVANGQFSMRADGKGFVVEPEG